MAGCAIGSIVLLNQPIPMTPKIIIAEIAPIQLLSLAFAACRLYNGRWLISPAT